MRISDWSSDVCSSDLALIADFCAPSLLCLWKRTFAPGQKGGKTMKWGQVSRVNSRTALMAGIAASMMWAAPAAAQERQSYTIPSGVAAPTVQRLAFPSVVQEIGMSSCSVLLCHFVYFLLFAFFLHTSLFLFLHF